MADTKISGLPASTTPLTGTEVLPLVQSSVTKKVSVNDLTLTKTSTFASLPVASTVSGQIYQVSDVGQNGSLWRSTGTKWVACQTISLCATGLPFIYVASGSISAVGAISGFTLDKIYPAAYCYFPANALATVSAAGWYYCVFSSTTAGTAYLNTYTSGVPTIPTSLTPVTDGKGAYTSPTASAITGPVITIPANTLGTTGQIRVNATLYNNSTANNKSYLFNYTGAGGTTVAQCNGVNQNFGSAGFILANQGAANVQYTSLGIRSAFSFSVVGASTTADTTADTSVAFVMNKATATDNMIFSSVSVELYNQ